MAYQAAVKLVSSVSVSLYKLRLVDVYFLVISLTPVPHTPIFPFVQRVVQAPPNIWLLFSAYVSIGC